MDSLDCHYEAYLRALDSPVPLLAPSQFGPLRDQIHQVHALYGIDLVHFVQVLLSLMDEITLSASVAQRNCTST